MIRSGKISRSVVSDSLRPHESQHARPPCPSPAPGVHWDSLPSSQWCHPAISSSVVPFSKPGSSLVAQTVKRLPTMQETWVQSLGREDLLEKEVAIHSSFLAWKIPWTEEPGLGYSPWGRKESDTTERLHSLTPSRASQVDSMIKNPPANARDPG